MLVSLTGVTLKNRLEDQMTKQEKLKRIKKLTEEINNLKKEVGLKSFND